MPGSTNPWANELLARRNNKANNNNSSLKRNDSIMSGNKSEEGKVDKSLDCLAKDTETVPKANINPPKEQGSESGAKAKKKVVVKKVVKKKPKAKAQDEAPPALPPKPATEKIPENLDASAMYEAARSQLKSAKGFKPPGVTKAEEPAEETHVDKLIRQSSVKAQARVDPDAPVVALASKCRVEEGINLKCNSCKCE